VARSRQVDVWRRWKSANRGGTWSARKTSWRPTQATTAEALWLAEDAARELPNLPLEDLL
jgi:hypothetical protein